VTPAGRRQSLNRALVLVTGAGGFIGQHLVRRLKADGRRVRAVDLVSPPYESSPADEFLIGDLRDSSIATRAAEGVDEVYALAADMGGMGYISSAPASILHNNLLIDANLIEAARLAGVKRFLYASSACVYPDYLQRDENSASVAEDDAYPAQPQDSYGWEKLIGERLCAEYRSQFGLAPRVVRLHNVYGPYGTWDGGREKAPAAICRKVALAKLLGEPEIEVWGDGGQLRSFCYIDDCIEGLCRIMQADHALPLNLGRERMIAIAELVDLVSDIADYEVRIRFVPGPEGVRARTSENTNLRKALGWEPRTPLEIGLKKTYAWIELQVHEKHRAVTNDTA